MLSELAGVAAVRRALWRALGRPLDEALGRPLDEALGRPLDEALDWMREHAVAGTEVDWVTLQRQARRLARSARPPAEAHRAIRFALAQLGERHGRLLAPGNVGPFRAGLAAGQGRGLGLVAVHPEHVVVQVAFGGPAMRAGVRVGDVVVEVNGQSLEALDGRLVLDPAPETGAELTLWRAQTGVIRVSLRPSEYGLTQLPRGRRLHGTVGYLDLPQAVTATAQGYITSAHRAIWAVDGAAIRGWVVDLRRNAGGDLYAMLAAVGPILGDGGLGGVVEANGRRMAWTYRDGGAFLYGSRRAGMQKPYRLDRPMPPVAVLTSRLTASAGEGVAVAFRGRPGTRSFGEPTAGVPTGLDATTLGDGSLLAVSTCLFADRTGRTYREAIPPDEPVVADWVLLGTDDDPVLRAAVRWLDAQAGARR